MKEIDNVEYYSISEIRAILNDRLNEDQIKTFFETGKIIGRLIDDHWYASKKVIEDFEEELGQKTLYFTRINNIDLTKVKLNGRVLDIGGGGEGVIGQIAGDHIVAIDPSEKELREAPGECLKIIMNAKDLKFLDESFDTITLFFTMMYIPISDHKKIFKEIMRVLKPNGEILLWDIAIPKKFEKEKNIYVIKLKIDIGSKIISTGYGTKWNKVVNIDYYLDLGKRSGFRIIEKELNGETFYIKFHKV